MFVVCSVFSPSDPSLKICFRAVVEEVKFVRGRRIVNCDCDHNCSRNDYPLILLSSLDCDGVTEAWYCRREDAVNIHKCRVIEMYLGKSHAL